MKTTRGIAALAWLMLTACVPVAPPRPAVDPQGQPITTAQIQTRMGSTWRTVDGTLLSLVGGAVGVFAGGWIGYQIGYPQDIKNGCEDCGLEGAALGALLGSITGMVVGGNVGWHAGAGADRRAALDRIIRERVQAAPRPAAAPCLPAPHVPCGPGR